MLRTLARSALALLLWLTTALDTQADTASLGGLEQEISNLYRQNAGAVARVKIATKEPLQNGEAKAKLAAFTGFFVSRDGKLLTNAIPDQAKARIWIEKDGISYLAEAIGTDSRSNVSLLRVLNLPEEFSYVKIESKAPTPPIGSFALALTSPFEFTTTPSLGIVTGYESRFEDLSFPFTYMRTSIPLGLAEGGSPLFSSSGQLIGIAVAALPELRSSYSIPAERLARIISDLERHGEVKHLVLPIRFDEQQNRISQKKQVAVASFEANSVFEKAGIKVGDVLEKVDDEKITHLNQLSDLLFAKATEETIQLRFSRGDKRYEVTLSP